MISRTAVPRECYIRHEILSPDPGLDKYRPGAFGALGERIKNVFIIIEMFSRTDRAVLFAACTNSWICTSGSLCRCIIDALLNKVCLAKAVLPDPSLFNNSIWFWLFICNIRRRFAPPKQIGWMTFHIFIRIFLEERGNVTGEFLSSEISYRDNRWLRRLRRFEKELVGRNEIQRLLFACLS